MSMRRDFVELIKNNDEYYDMYRECIDDKGGTEDIGGFQIEYVESFGGEGKGDTLWTVFSLERDGEKKYFKLDGWYASYEGGTYDDYYDFYEVEQVEKMVKVWEIK